MPIDRESRDKLADSISRYLADETTAFQFDDEVFGIRDATVDPTVKHVADALWYFYDDLTDHKVVLSKEAWDFVQRLLLLLKSDVEIEVEKQWHWSWRQLIAAVSLFLFLWCAYEFGFGLQLLVLAIPFGLLSILIARFKKPQPSDRLPPEVDLYPFSTVSELARVRRRTVGFVKRSFPPEVASRQIRRFVWHLPQSVNVCVLHVHWLIFGPLVLGYQVLPHREVRTRLVVP